jgi:hypothetical protein
VEILVQQSACCELKTKNLRQVCKEMVFKDEANSPRDLQQLRDLKYRTEGKSATSNGNNVADDILNVWELSSCLTTPMYSTMALVERSWLPGLLNQVTRFLKSGCRFKVV